ncbi:extracellular solute-binding protein [Telmatospirillum siberiense]|uniref:extracellular solute-binding protein n=1 Tax=Telmatospirillum siberiense TaxID=382514 RepID=UPI00130475DC|nr:extracellular solute-binding protein [Telmatospirillum siberiense]
MTRSGVAKSIVFLVTAALLLLAGGGESRAGQGAHALALYGTPKYPPDFKHFDYVNPDAPKGGLLRLYQLGGFDTLNPFSGIGHPPLARGATARPIDLIGLTFDSLLARSEDEPASAYGLIAESFEWDRANRWLVFNLRPEARFHDGSAITADDVLFSFETLRNSGPPGLKASLQGVTRGEKLADRKVRFIFGPGETRALPLVLGSLPILSKSWWQGRDFTRPLAEPPLGSGPYAVQSVDPGRSVVLVRAQDYWAKDLPVATGLYNFDRIRTDFFADSPAAFSAFKNGAYDVRFEWESRKWATGYVFPALTRGLVNKLNIPNRRTEPMRGFAFNLRNPLWRDPRTRRALILAFDFESLNHDLFYGLYRRAGSYFAKSELAAPELPSDEETLLLEAFRGQVPDELFAKPYSLPDNADHAQRQRNLAEAAHLLSEAGWTMKKGKLVDGQGGKPFVFEILVDDPSWQPICKDFLSALHHLGIQASVHAVEEAEFSRRRAQAEFDMIVARWPASETPGTEQRTLWGSAAADQPDGLNWAGIRSPAIDRTIDALAASPDRQTLVTRTHALDRLLLWGDYVIPQWYMPEDHVAVWDKFGIPAVTPDQGAEVLAWWVAPEKSKPAAKDPVKARP